MTETQGWLMIGYLQFIAGQNMKGWAACFMMASGIILVIGAIIRSLSEA